MSKGPFANMTECEVDKAMKELLGAETNPRALGIRDMIPERIKAKAIVDSQSSIYAKEIWNAAIDEAANQVGGYSISDLCTIEIILKLKVT